jgi:hypothetical protein
VGNARIYTSSGAETFNWNFYANDGVTVNTDGWRKLFVNPEGWGNPTSERYWILTSCITLNPGSYSCIVINGW